MNWKPPRKQRPRDEWGRFRSQADILAEQNDARLQSLQAGMEERCWQSQYEAEEG